MKTLKILFFSFVCFAVTIPAYCWCDEGSMQYRVDPADECGTQSRTCCGYSDVSYDDGEYSIDFAPAESYFPEYGQSCCSTTECYNSVSKKCEAISCPSDMKVPANGYLSKDGMCSDGWDYSSCNYACNSGYCYNSSAKTCDAKPSDGYCYVINGTCKTNCSCYGGGWKCVEQITCNSGYSLKDTSYGKRCVSNNSRWYCVGQEGDCNEWGNGWGYPECSVVPHDGGSCNPYNFTDFDSYTCASTDITGYDSGYSCYDCTCN